MSFTRETQNFGASELLLEPALYRVFLIGEASIVFFKQVYRLSKQVNRLSIVFFFGWRSKCEVKIFFASALKSSRQSLIHFSTQSARLQGRIFFI